jgi:hypothetical protein
MTAEVINVTYYEGNDLSEHAELAGNIDKSKVTITETVELISRCAAEFATLHTSLEGQDETRAIVNDVHVCVTRQEALYAKSRELCTHYDTLVKASKTLAERVNALNAVILPSDEETRVHSPVNDTQGSDKKDTVLQDDAFDADALKREMEETLKPAEYDEIEKGVFARKPTKHRWWHKGTRGGLND